MKVLDFGLAKSMNMQDRALTATATAMGSPQYMSPEQMKAARDIDFRTDIWSLGVCLYELVSAHVPFDAAAVPVLCAMVLKDEPTPLPTFRPDVALALWAIIQKCLMKSPAQRFATVSELAAALEPFAPPEAQGAGLRIAAVLHAVPAGSGRPGALGTGIDHELQQTRIAAAFESRPEAERGSSSTHGCICHDAGGRLLKKLTRAVIGSVMVVGCWARPAHADDSAHDKAVTAFQEGRSTSRPATAMARSRSSARASRSSPPSAHD